MKNSDARKSGVASSDGRDQLSATSGRKLKANRENAKKSTGPRTLRGKAFSARNAVKHGLFVNYVTDFEALDEDPKEYQELLNGLWDQYQPVGRGEEVEVERIALCCWRLKRAWRYENAVNLAARRDFIGPELKAQIEYCEEKDKEEAAILAELEIAKNEMKETDHLSEETKQRIFALDPNLKRLWAANERCAQEHFAQAEADKLVRKLTPERRDLFSDLYSVVRLIPYFEKVGRERFTNVIETAVGRHAIPDSESLEKILRYEAAIERSRSRAIEQLDRLQRRRMGELIPPTVRVHLS